MKYSKLLIIFFAFVTFSCNTETEIGSIVVKGIIKEQGFSTYQYGTHTLTTEGNILYALRSETIDLDKYIDKKVTVTGHKVEGYPVDGGPEYLDVTEVR